LHAWRYAQQAVSWESVNVIVAVVIFPCASVAVSVTVCGPVSENVTIGIVVAVPS
jgi:hypothetical protein